MFLDHFKPESGQTLVDRCLLVVLLRQILEIFWTDLGLFCGLIFRPNLWVPYNVWPIFNPILAKFFLFVRNFEEYFGPKFTGYLHLLHVNPTWSDCITCIHNGSNRPDLGNPNFLWVNRLDPVRPTWAELTFNHYNIFPWRGRLKEEKLTEESSIWKWGFCRHKMIFRGKRLSYGITQVQHIK